MNLETFILVEDGAYGISFTIVRAESEKEARELSGITSSDSPCYNFSEFSDSPKGVVYVEEPTGG